jgi:hypothetical protein
MPKDLKVRTNIPGQKAPIQQAYSLIKFPLPTNPKIGRDIGICARQALI